MQTPSRMFVGSVAFILVMLLSGCQNPAPSANQTASAPGDAVESATDTPTTAASMEAASSPTAAAEAATVVADAAVCVTPDRSLVSVAGDDEPGYPFSGYAQSFTKIVSGWNTSTDSTPATIDDHVVAFVVAHGTPLSVKLGGQSIDLPLVPAPIGNCGDGHDGKLRYYIIDSCNVMAHGPRCPTNYSCPGRWAGDIFTDTDGMRNVYARWGQKLGNNLRMVCGPSTLINPANVSKVIQRYNDPNHAISVADSVLGGFAQNAVAACLTLGDQDVTATPLVTDMDFVPDGNASGETFYHLQYSKPTFKYQTETQTLPAHTIKNSALFPTCMPAVATGNLTVESKTVGKQELDFPTVDTEDRALSQTLSDAAYIEIAKGLMSESELTFDFSPDPAVSVVRMMLANTPVDGSAPQLVAQKNLQIVFTPRFDPLKDIPNLSEKDAARMDKPLEQLRDFLSASDISVDEGPLPFPFLDEDSRIEVWLNNSGTPITIVRRRQPILDWLDLEAIIPPDQALKLAQGQLGDKPELYDFDSWAFGYASSFDYSQLHLWYKFRFAPNEDLDLTTADASLREIWIPASTGESCPE